MPDSKIAVNHRYVSILRCRTWCVWPERTRVVSKAFTVPVGSGSAEVICLSVHLVSYEGRPHPKDSPGKPTSESTSPILWRGDLNTGYWIGQSLVKAPDDVFKLELKHEPALQGEIDIQLHLGTQSEVAKDDLKKIASAISFSVLSYINIALGDLLVPVAPIQVGELGESGRTFEKVVLVLAWERKTFDAEALQTAVDEYVQSRVRMSQGGVRALDAAMRRYLSALTENDAIDKYCDLWETCEFASFGIKAKGGKVGHVAQALASHIGRKKALVENKLEIKKLYDVRNDIVHNAEENPTGLNWYTTVLERIARELIRFRVGLPYKGDKVLEDALNKE